MPSYDDFFEPEKNNLEPLKIVFSAFKLPYNVGSASSIDLFSSFLKSQNKAIYKLLLVKTFIRTRWNTLKPIIVVYTILVWLNLVFLFLLFENFFALHFIIPFLFVNFLLFLWEMAQIIKSGLSYFADYWNILDLLRIATTVVWLTLLFLNIDKSAIPWAVSLLSVIRGVSGFRDGSWSTQRKNG